MSGRGHEPSSRDRSDRGHASRDCRESTEGINSQKYDRYSANDHDRSRYLCEEASASDSMVKGPIGRNPHPKGNPQQLADFAEEKGINYNTFIANKLDCRSEKNPLTITLHMLPLYQMYIKAYFTCRTAPDKFSHDSKDIISHIEAATEVVINNILDGTCELQDLQLLSGQTESFQSYVASVFPETYQQSPFNETLDAQMRELDEYLTFVSDISKFSLGGDCIPKHFKNLFQRVANRSTRTQHHKHDPYVAERDEHKTATDLDSNVIGRAGAGANIKMDIEPGQQYDVNSDATNFLHTDKKIYSIPQEETDRMYSELHGSVVQSDIREEMDQAAHSLPSTGGKLKDAQVPDLASYCNELEHLPILYPDLNQLTVSCHERLQKVQKAAHGKELTVVNLPRNALVVLGESAEQLQYAICSAIEDLNISHVLVRNYCRRSDWVMHSHLLSSEVERQMWKDGAWSTDKKVHCELIVELRKKSSLESQQAFLYSAVPAHLLLSQKENIGDENRSDGEKDVEQLIIQNSNKHTYVFTNEKKETIQLQQSPFFVFRQWAEAYGEADEQVGGESRTFMNDIALLKFVNSTSDVAADPTEVFPIPSRDHLDILAQRQQRIFVGGLEGRLIHCPQSIGQMNRRCGLHLSFIITSKDSDGMTIALKEGDSGLLVFFQGKQHNRIPAGMLVSKFSEDIEGFDSGIYHAVVLSEALKEVQHRYRDDISDMQLLEIRQKFEVSMNETALKFVPGVRFANAYDDVHRRHVECHNSWRHITIYQALVKENILADRQIADAVDQASRAVKGIVNAICDGTMRVMDLKEHCREHYDNDTDKLLSQLSTLDDNFPDVNQIKWCLSQECESRAEQTLLEWSDVSKFTLYKRTAGADLGKHDNIDEQDSSSEDESTCVDAETGSPDDPAGKERSNGPKVHFQAYISKNIQKELGIKRLEVRDVSAGHAEEEASAICEMTERGKWKGAKSRGAIWEDCYEMKPGDAEPTYYHYGRCDEDSGKVVLEETMMCARAVEGHTKAYDVTKYDGAVIFTTIKGTATSHQSAIKAGFHAMQPPWLMKIKGDIRLDCLLSWIDQVEDVDEAMQIRTVTPENLQQKLKKWVKRDIDDHVEWIKDPNHPPTKAKRLFLSMIGLIYRSAKYLGLSKKELLPKLDTLIKDTMSHITNVAKQWKSWLDESLSSHKEQLAKSLLASMQEMSKDGSHNHWLLLIPIYHYMSPDACVIDFQTESVISERSSRDFKSCVEDFQKHHSKLTETMLSLLEPFLEGDPLLSYSIMELMDDDHFATFLATVSGQATLEFRLDAILNRCLSGKHDSSTFYWTKGPLIADVIRIVDKMQKCELSQLGIRLNRILWFAGELRQTAASELKRMTYVKWSNVKEVLNLCLLLLSLYEKNSSHLQQTSYSSLKSGMNSLWEFAENPPTRESLKEAVLNLAGWVKADSQALTIWENLSQIAPQGTRIEEMWNQEWRKRFKNVLSKVHASKVVESISTAKSSEYLCACAQYMLCQERWTKYQSVAQDLQKYVELYIIRSWTDCANGSYMDVTMKMLKRHPEFIEIDDYAKKHTMAPENINIIKHIKRATSKLMTSISDETCKLADFEQLLVNRHNFFLYLHSVLPKECETYKTVISDRNQQLDDLHAFALRFSATYGRSYEALISPETDVELNFVTKQLQFEEMYNHWKNFAPFVSALKEPAATHKPMTKAITDAFHSTSELVDSMKNGTLKVRKLRELCEKSYGNNSEKFLQELRSLEISQSVIHKVKTCIEDSNSYKKRAQTLLQLKSLFDICEEFPSIALMAKTDGNFEDLEMQSVGIPDSVPQALDEWKLRCLQVFLDCSDFVDWIRRQVEESAISTYVHIAKDLYPLSEDKDAKSSQLLNALTGYAPLLYNFDDCKKDLTELFERCNKIWENVTHNEELPKQLRQCNDDLDILKRVGNEICKSVFDARDINDTGEYEIGSDDGQSCKTVNDVLRLRYGRSGRSGGEAEGGTKIALSFDDVEDIQSKLALAGDVDVNKETIETFQQVKDAVTRLAEVYLEIRKEACVHFEQLKVVVYCNKGSQNEVMEVHFQSTKECLRGLKSEENSNLKHCTELYDYLRTCIEEWKYHTNLERSEFKELNFYTSGQLVILRKELARFNLSKSSSSIMQALPLLEMIRPIGSEDEELFDIVQNCEPGLCGSKFGKQTSPELTKTQRENIRNLRKRFPGEKDEDRVNAVLEKGDKSIMKAGFDTYVIYFQNLHRQRNKNTAELAEAMKDSIVATQDEMTLQKRLSSLWDTLTDHTDKTIKDLLSLRHLALILRKLNCPKEPAEAPEELVTRTLPKWLSPGKPALVGIPSHETYKFVLSLYEKDVSSTYPTRNEVLLCNSKTTGEEVELFISRALDGDGSCYCLVNCHLLKSDVCQKIEKQIRGKGVGAYGLVLVYDGKVRKCYIKSCLDKLYIRASLTSKESELKKTVGSIIHTAVERKSSVSVDRVFVKLIRSRRAGVGKTLVYENFLQKWKKSGSKVESVTISIHKSVDVDSIVERLINTLPTCEANSPSARIVIHIDIAPEVTSGVDDLLFNLLILRSLPHTDGRVWQAKPNHYYFVECMLLAGMLAEGDSFPELLQLLPATDCISPKEASHNYSVDPEGKFQGFDINYLHDEKWQLVLRTFVWNRSSNRKDYNPDTMEPVSGPQESLELLLDECGIEDPSWDELGNFVKFLSFQLSKVKKFLHNSAEASSEELPELAAFLIDFMVDMARDFATHSPSISEESQRSLSVSQDHSAEPRPLFKPAKKWEQHDYPYLFLREDGKTFSTLGICPIKSRADRHRVQLNSKSQQDGDKHYTIPLKLYDGLKQRKLLPSLGKEDFEGTYEDDSARKQKCLKLREVMAAQSSYEASEMFSDENFDENYVLTLDNAKKILAIYTRFTTGMPVIIMGETGCGKTKLIEFMSKLQVPTGLKDRVEPLVVLKVHGGTTNKEIVDAINEAGDLADQNQLEAESFADGRQVPQIFTILFFDEVNTTDEIGLIKEIMCDHRMNGDPLKIRPNLKFIAACNPYRWTDSDMVEKSRAGGLGQHENTVDDTPDEDTTRKLVYQVHPLPESLKSIVWDFGDLPTDKDLSKNVELQYIRGIVSRMQQVNTDQELRFRKEKEKGICELIATAQLFMRDHPEECRFVSLRDVERLLVVSNWFFKQREYLFAEMNKLDEAGIWPEPEPRSVMLGLGVCYSSRLRQPKRLEFYECIAKTIKELMNLKGKMTGDRVLRMQIGLCKRVFAREVIAQAVLADQILQDQSVTSDRQSQSPSSTNQHPSTLGAHNLSTKSDHDQWKTINKKHQKTVPRYVQTSNNGQNEQRKAAHSAMPTDSKNTTDTRPAATTLETTDPYKNVRSAGLVSKVPAQSLCITENRILRENLFMMVTCFDTRIPLFVIGKPGTSKSLANSLLAKAMQGEKAKSPLLSRLKFVFQESFQCSRHTTPDQITKVFSQCAWHQNWHKLEEFVSVVLLDEIGLAEQAEQNPLKTLHPLLESSCYGDEPSKNKCGFLGISNWALDPAKMNRGLFLQIDPPDDNELSKFARELLYSLGEKTLEHVPLLTDGYLSVCGKLSPYKDRTQFYGLRDFYSLLKMIAHFGKTTRQILEYCIRRNFGEFAPSLDNFDSVKIFFSSAEPPPAESPDQFDLPSSYAETIKSSLLDQHTRELETRHKMIISENISFLSVILEMLEQKGLEDGQEMAQFGNKKEYRKPEVIFGKAFEDDISYTQVCKNVYKIRMCMESGQAVILIDVDDLHEGLYELLNQSYKTLKGKRYVDLGIGVHRVQAHVHDDFKLLLIAGRKDVYSTAKFPIPLINRFEKHYMSAATFLDQHMKVVKESLDQWMKIFENAFADAKRQYMYSKDEELAYTTSFIGYNSEMTSLIVEKASKNEIGTLSEVVGKLKDVSKKMLLQCATAESVLRLDTSSTISDVQKIYAEEQRHDNLLVYLENELGNSSDDSHIFQVTTFAEVMNGADIEVLEDELNERECKVEVKSMFLASFRQEVAFKKALRKEYEAEMTKDCRILIIQCESANKDTKLLNFVRYILLQEYKVRSTHTVLLLSLARGQEFTSFQGGAWRCVHIDDPRFHSFTLPPLYTCMQKRIYELMDVEPVDDGEEDELPLLADSDDEEDLYMDREVPETSVPSVHGVRQVDEQKVFPDQLEFIKDCVPQALSIIGSHHDECYNRAAVLQELLSENSDFTRQFLRHVRDLLKRHEQTSGVHWTAVNAADANKMKKAETMRRALTDTIEEEFRPAIAAVIASIDPHRNLKLLGAGSNPKCEKIAKLWMGIFKLSHEIGLTFEECLPQAFRMFHAGDEKEMRFETKFPFSWKVKDAVDSLRDTLDAKADPDGSSLSELFKLRRIGEVLAKEITDTDTEIVEAYLHDFLCLTYSFEPSSESYEIIRSLMMKHLEDGFPDGYGIPKIHVAYESLKDCLKNMAAVFELREKVAEDVKKKILASPAEGDKIALSELVKHLSEVDLDLLTKDPECWIAQVDLCKSLTETIIGGPTNDLQTTEIHRVHWPKLEFKRLYAKYVIIPEKPDPVAGRSGQFVSDAVGEEDVADYHKNVEFQNTVERLRNVLEFYESYAIDSNDNEEFSRTLNDFFIAFVHSNLVFPINGCPEVELLEWLSTFVTFRCHKKFDLRKCETELDPTKCLLHVDTALLQCYFRFIKIAYDDLKDDSIESLKDSVGGTPEVDEMVGNSRMIHNHMDDVISSLDNRCSTTDNQLATLKSIVQCYKSMKFHSKYSELDAGDVKEAYPAMRQRCKQPSLEAIQVLSDIQQLITSGIEPLYQSSATEAHLHTSLGELLHVSSSAGDLQPGLLAVRTILNNYGESFAIDFVNSSDNLLILDNKPSSDVSSVLDIFNAFGESEYPNAKNWIFGLCQQHGVTITEVKRLFGNDTSAMLQAIFTTFIWKPTASVPKSISERFIAAMTDKSTHVKLMLKLLLTKDKWPKELSVTTSKGAHMSLLVVHLFTSVANGEQSYDNFPFHEIIVAPEKAGKHLLPTMPDGPLDTLLKQLDFLNEDINEMHDLCIYVCSSGHPFIVTPNGSRNCPLCPTDDSSIEDQHRLCRTLLGEIMINELRSKKGHIVGSASTQTETPKGIRQLSALSCAVIRCLTHLSILTSSLLHPDEVTKLIQPRLRYGDAVPFLVAHIWTDLQQIAQCCRESIENCIFLLHNIMHALSGVPESEHSPNMEDVNGREDWEASFHNKYIKSTFGEEKSTVMRELKDQMKTEVSAQWSDALKEFTSTSVESVDKQDMFMDPRLWDFELPLTIENLIGKLHPTKQVNPALFALVPNYDALSALKYLPNILKLGKLIADRFHGQLSREDAKITMEDFLVKHAEKLKLSNEEWRTLIDSYVSAWRICSSSIYIGFVGASTMSLKSELSEFLFDKCDLLMSRPLNLIRHLVDAHNDVVSNVPVNDSIAGDSMLSEPLELSTVTPSQLVTVPSRDVICQLLTDVYQCKVDEEEERVITSMQSNAVFEWVGNRKRITLKVDELPFYKFEEDSELWKQIELLKSNQDKLSEKLKVSIIEFVNRSKTSLNGYIDELEIIINHLSAMPKFNPNMKLHELTAKLCMATPSYLGEKTSHMRKDTLVKHVIHIWLQLKYAQADLFMEQHEHGLQNPFDDIHVDYLKEGPGNTEAIVEEEFELKHVRADFLIHLFEFITLRLNKGMAMKDTNPEAAGEEIGEALKRFVAHEDLAYNQCTGGFPVMPPELKVCHAVYLWTRIWRKDAE